MRTSDSAIIFIIVSLFVFSGPAHGEEAQENEKSFFKDLIKVDLGAVNSNQENNVKPRLSLELGPRDWEGNERGVVIGRGYLQAGLEGQFVQVWDDQLDIEPSFIKGKTGLLWKLSEVEESGTVPPSPGAIIVGETDSNAVLKYNYGGISLNAQAQVETDDDASNVNLVGGAELVYSSYGAFKKFFLSIPSCGVAYEYVEPTEAETRDQLGADTSSFPRMRSFVLWNWEVGQKLAADVMFMEHLAIQVHYRYAREYEQSDAWKNKGYDEYDQITAKLRYNLPADKRATFRIREIYAGFSSGRQLAQAEDDDRILLGILIQ